MRDIVRFMSYMVVAAMLSSCGETTPQPTPPGTTPPGTTPPTTPVTKALGSLYVPDGQVVATATSALVAGKSASFRIELKGMQGVKSVEAMVGTDYEDPGLIGKMASINGNSWSASIVLPDPLPAQCRLFVRVTAADGGVQESGIANFALAQP